jgi:hypothetical protein
MGLKSKKIAGQFRINKMISFAILIFGIALIPTAAFYDSMLFAVIGLALTFWGAVLLYVAPSPHVPLELLKVTTMPALVNTDKMISSANVDGKGWYLPPRFLRDFESSLVYISAKPDQKLPSAGEIDDDKLIQPTTMGICLTPPGLTLSKLFEEKLGISFTKTDFDTVQKRLPKLLVEDLEMADRLEVKKKDDTVTVKVGNSILNGICQETRKLEKTHALVGCVLSSAIACALAKATGNPVAIEREEQSDEGATVTIQYRIFEGQ